MHQSVFRTFFRCRFAFRAISRILANTTANATLEMALTISILGAPLLLGTAAVGFLIYDSIEVSNAAHAGAAYGMLSDAFAHNTTQISAVAHAEASDLGANLTVATPTIFFACSAAINGAQFSTSDQAETACGNSGISSNQPLEFIQVNTAASVPPIFQFPGLPKQWILRGQSVMMVQE